MKQKQKLVSDSHKVFSEILKKTSELNQYYDDDKQLMQKLRDLHYTFSKLEWKLIELERWKDAQIIKSQTTSKSTNGHVVRSN